MALRNIRVDGDPVLRKKCKEVKKTSEHLLELIDDMFETMYEENGVGLAAPQIGVLMRLVVIDIGNDEPLVLINPEIVETKGEQTGDEGCLSIPGKVGTVTRPDYVKCKAYDENLDEFVVEGTGLLARAICHELDHLDGVLYKDHVKDGLRGIE